MRILIALIMLVVLVCLASPTPGAEDPSKLVLYEVVDYVIAKGHSEGCWPYGNITYEFKVPFTVRYWVEVKEDNFTWNESTLTLYVKTQAIHSDPVQLNWMMNERVIEPVVGWGRKSEYVPMLEKDHDIQTKIAERMAWDHHDKLSAQMPDRLRKFAYTTKSLSDWAHRAVTITEGTAGPAASKPIVPSPPADKGPKPALPPANVLPPERALAATK